MRRVLLCVAALLVHEEAIAKPDVVEGKPWESMPFPSLKRNPTREEVAKDKDNCERKNDLKACVRTGFILFRMTPSKPHFKPWAAKLFDRGCFQGKDMEACAMLALMYQRGDGVPVDSQLATKLHERMCNVGKVTYGCNAAGSEFIKAEDYIKAAAYFQKSCDIKTSLACLNYSSLVFQGHGELKEDKETAYVYMRKYNDWERQQKAKP